MGRQWQWPRPAGRNPSNDEDCCCSTGTSTAAKCPGYQRVPARSADSLPGSRSRSSPESTAVAAQHQARLQALNADGQLRGQLLLRGAVHFLVLRGRRRRRARSGRERHPGGVPAAPPPPQPEPTSSATKERTLEVGQLSRGHRIEPGAIRPAAEHHPAAEHPQQGQVPSVV